MIRFHWLSNLLGVARSRKERRRLAARSRKPVRPMLESLEDRLTPSTIQTAGDYATLSGLIQSDTAASTNYIIQITNNFAFSSGGQVSISKLGAGSTLTIEGQNGNHFSLTGNGNRLFTIARGQNVTFEDLTLTGGTVKETGTATSSLTFAAGGGILDQGGNVTLSKVTVQGNSVSGYEAGGGGIFVSQGGSLTLQGGSSIQSNRASGNNGSKGSSGGSAYGGGVYVSGSSTLRISDSVVGNNSVQGGQGADQTALPKTTALGAGSSGSGGSAYGGGLYVAGSGWTVALTGDTFSGNTALGGSGGSGLTGSNASAANTTGGNGGSGGSGGYAEGGAAFFSIRTGTGLGGSGTLAILNDSASPSIWIDNSVQGGSGGGGGDGGTSNGAAKNANGGAGGFAGAGQGGALQIGASYTSSSEATLTANVANTAFYGNKATGGNGGNGGAAGTGGTGAAGTAGTDASGGVAQGGGLELNAGNVILANNTVANNRVTGGFGKGSGPTIAQGGGIDLFYFNGTGITTATATLYNNTITQNSGASGAGVFVELPFSSYPPPPSDNPILVNNLIQGNLNGSTEDDLTSYATLTNANNNFIGSTTAVSTTTNIVGNSQTQLGIVVGVDSTGKASGGPIYYPLLSGVASIGAGSTSVLNTIASVEATTTANAADQIGDFRAVSNSIDLGATQLGASLAPPPPPPPPPGPPPAPQTVGSYTDLVNAVAADTGTGANYVIEITNNFTFDSGGQVNVSKLGAGSTLTIEGQNGNKYTLTGDGNRLFEIAKGQNVIFENLTLTGGGSVALGGAILDHGGNITLSKVAVQGNTVSQVGGGIFVSAGGDLTVQGGSTIQSNHVLAADIKSGSFAYNSNLAAGGGCTSAAPAWCKSWTARSATIVPRAVTASMPRLRVRPAPAAARGRAAVCSSAARVGR